MHTTWIVPFGHLYCEVQCVASTWVVSKRSTKWIYSNHTHYVEYKFVWCQTWQTQPDELNSAKFTLQEVSVQRSLQAVADLKVIHTVVFSFCAEDLYTGHTVTYNIDQSELASQSYRRCSGACLQWDSDEQTVGFSVECRPNYIA